MLEKKRKLLKIKAKYTFCVYPKFPIILGEDDNNYGITKWNVLETLEARNCDNPKNNITVTGKFGEPLSKNKRYILFLSETENPKYGKQYELIYIREDIDLHESKDMRFFLAAVLSPSQFEEFYKTYEDPYEILDSGDINNLTKIKGVGEQRAKEIMERFNKTKDFSDVIVELYPYDFTPTMLENLITTYNSSSLIIDTIQNHPYKLSEDIVGIGFAKADAVALKGGLNYKSPERIQAYIEHFLKSQSEEGNSYMYVQELVANIYEYFEGKDNILENYYDSNGNIKGNNIQAAINTLKNNGTIVVEDGESKGLRKIYLTEIYELECKIAENLKRLMEGENHFDYSNWREKIVDVEIKNNFEFDEVQKAGILLGLQNQVCLISGLAGTGKSSLVSGILASLPGYSFAQCALSGKAAARLQEVTKSEGSTIHRLLGYFPEGGFKYNKDNPLPYDIIVLDELSLVGGDIFLHLIEAIPSGSKLIMLGDLGQLESIGALNIASDIFNSKTIPSIELKKIHRQGKESGIISSAHKIRNHQQLFTADFEGILKAGIKEDMVFDISQDRLDTLDKTMDWFEKWYNDPLVNKDIMNIQLISPVRERGESSVYELNREAQKYLLPNIKKDDPHMEIGTQEQPCNIYVGDKVMCIKNNYALKDVEGKEAYIYNGWVGKVTDIYDKTAVIYFPMIDAKVKIKTQLARYYLSLGYASTVHKLQGSDTKVVIGAVDYTTPPKMLSSQLLYTLLTRAKKHCVLVAQTGAMGQAIMTDNVSTKRTFLKNLLDSEEMENE